MSKGSFCKVIIIGNLGADPEIRYTQNNKAVANLSVATTESWKDKATGEPREETEWHKVVLFNRLAEIAGEYLKKGSKILVEGKIKTRKYQAQDGSDRYVTEVHGNEMQMLDSPSAGAGSQQTQGQQQQAPQGGYNNAPQQGQQGGYNNAPQQQQAQQHAPQGGYNSQQPQGGQGGFGGHGGFGNGQGFN